MVRSRELNGDFSLFSQALYRLSLSYWANPSPQTSALPAELLHPRVSVGNWFFLRLVFVHYERSSRGARVTQWWERSPPTNVARVQLPELTPYVGWVCCWFSPLLLAWVSGLPEGLGERRFLDRNARYSGYLTPRGFSPGTLVFPSPQIPTLRNSNSIWNARTRLNEVIGTPKCFVGKKAIF